MDSDPRQQTPQYYKCTYLHDVNGYGHTAGARARGGGEGCQRRARLTLGHVEQLPSEQAVLCCAELLEVYMFEVYCTRMYPLPPLALFGSLGTDTSAARPPQTRSDAPLKTRDRASVGSPLNFLEGRRNVPTYHNAYNREVYSTWPDLVSPLND